MSALDCPHDCFRCAADTLTDALKDLFLEVAVPIVDRIPWLEPAEWVGDHLSKQESLLRLVALGVDPHTARAVWMMPKSERTMFEQLITLGFTVPEAYEHLEQQ